MIERIYIHNYRCFENFTLDLGGQKSALIIGKNGSGKSTLRHALGVFRSICSGPNRAKEWINPGDFWQNKTTLPMRFEITVTLTDKQFIYGITVAYANKSREMQVFEERLAVDGKEVFFRLQSLVTLSTGATFFLGRDIGTLPIMNEGSGEGSIQQLKAFLSSMILISPVPHAISGFAEEESSELLEDASNFSEWLNAVLVRQPARYGDIEKYLQAVIPDFGSFEFVPRGERGKQLFVEFRDESRSMSVDFKRLSDGEKCFFLSALIVAANRPESPVFCLWDEPDTHLSLPEVSHFITALRRLGNNKGQFIATSHSPEVIRRFSDENTLIFARNSHLEPTVVRPLKGIKYQGDLIEALLRNEVIE